MKKNLRLLKPLHALFAMMCTFTIHATVVPYLPPLQAFGGLTANLSTFTPIEGDYTLEVQGTVGTQISVAGGFYTYTPTTSSTVRFSQKNGKVFVYEGNVYMTTITPTFTIAYPVITDANATTNTSNLLTDPSFENKGALISGTAYKFGTSWTTNITEAALGIRITYSTTGLVNGTYVCVWRGSGNTSYFAQALNSKIKPNTSYQVIVRETAGGNAYANFYLGLGSTASGQEYDYKTLSLGNTKTGTWNVTLHTPQNINSTTYFTFKNSTTNTANSGSDPVVQMDYLALVEGTVSVSAAGVTGVSSATFLAGTAYSPENISINYSGGDSYDYTLNIINPSFELATAYPLYGWTNTGLIVSNNTGAGSGWTKDGNVFAEKYIAGPGTLTAASLTQTVNNIPNGRYRLTLLAHAIQQSNTGLVTTGASVFAGATSTPVNVGGTYTVDNIPVLAGSLNIGYQLAGTITCNWTGFDNFKLYYLGPIIDPILSAPQTTTAFTTTANTATIGLTGANLTNDVSITVPSTHITLSGGNVTGTSPNYTIALANGNQLNSITATWDKAANVTGNLTFASTTATKSVAVTTSDVESVALSGITTSVGGLSPVFAVGSTTYTAKVPADITSTTITATATPLATVTNSGTVISAATSSVVLTGKSYNGVNQTSGYTVNWGGNYAFSDWAANGDVTSTSASLPSTYGWKCMNTTSSPAVEELIWTNFVTQSNCRYRDANPLYTYNTADYSAHRVMFIRWDAGGATKRVFSYPVKLEACKTYSFTSKAAWNSNGAAPTLTYSINTANDNSGTTYATGTAVTGASGALVDGNITNISVPTTGVYYLTITSSTASLCAIADLSLIQNSTATLGSSATTLSFDTNTTSKTFIITGNALTSDVSLSAPTGITLDITSIPAANAQCGVTVTATFDKSATVRGGSITATSDVLTQNITVNASADNTCFTPLYTDRTNIISDPFFNNLSAYSLSWGNAVLTTDPTLVYCGINSGVVTGTNAGSFAYPLTGKWAVNTSYRVKAKVNVTSGTFQLSVSGWSGAAADVVNSIPVTSGWQDIDFTFTTGATITSGNQYVYFNNYGLGAGTGYIDNLEMYAVPLVRASSASLSLTPAANTANVDITGNNLAGDITLTVPSGITLSGTNVTGIAPTYTIALANANGTNTVTATWDKNATISSGTITVSTTSATNVSISIVTADVDASSIASVIIGPGGFLSPAFATGTVTYTIKAPADIASVTVTGTATSAAATISNNGNPVSNGNSVTLGCTSYSTQNTANYTFNWGGNFTLPDWAANGDNTASSASLPSTYGWKCTNLGSPNTVVNTWNNFGTQANCRYKDDLAYTYGGVSWTGRALLIRWDGAGGNISNSVYSYPVYLQTGTTYQINGKAAWNSNASAPTLIFKINSASDNSGSIDYAASTVLTGASGVLKDINLRSISVPTTGVYYLTITASTASLCAIADLALNTQIVQTISGDNNWSSNSWSGGRTPLAGDNITVSSGTLTIDQNASANTITVMPGAKVTLSSGNTLNVGNLVLNSDATGTATFVDADATGTTINATVQQFLTSGRNWYVSVPVTSANMSALSSAASVVGYDEPTASWMAPSASTLNPLRGYVSVSTTTNGNVSFSGNLNTGAQSITLSRTAGATKEGYNLVGNPYPSYVSWDAAEKTNLETTMWYRTTNGTSYVFDTYNADAQVGTSNNGQTVNSDIPPMQAFWVRVKPALDGTSTTGSLTFRNAMRAHKGSQTVGSTTTPDVNFKAPAAKTKTMAQVQQVLRLQVSNGINSDEAIVLFNPNATNGLDDYDSPKMSNNDPVIPEIYTTLGTENLVINGLNMIIPDQEIPLVLKPGTSSQLSIKASELSNFDAGTRVLLRDYQDPNNVVEQDLTNGAVYSFAPATTATTTTRFTLAFKSPSVVTGITGTDAHLKVSVYQNGNGQLTVSCPVEVIGTALVSVYNALGQKLENKLLTSTVTSFSKSIMPGVYLVSVTVNGKSTIQKVIIK